MRWGARFARTPRWHRRSVPGWMMVWMMVRMTGVGCRRRERPDVLPGTLQTQAESLLAACRAAGKKVVTAESCTGGLVVATLTEIAGSSDVVERGFVTYSNVAKHEMIGVPTALITEHGAVSEEVARAMAEGALAHSRADIAVSVTGVAGPEGGTPEKPVGLVCFGLARRDKDGRGAAATSERQVFAGDRAAVRNAAVSRAMVLLRGAL